MQMKKDLDDIEKVSDVVIQLDVVGAHSLSLSQTHTQSINVF
jgi:hypothetical protein